MNSKGQFSIIAALLVAVVLIGTVITTYATLRYSTSQDQPQVLSAIDETNLALEKVLGFTVGYYGSVLQVTGNSSYAHELAWNYTRSGLENIGDIQPAWGSSFNLTALDLSTNWFTNTSYSTGQLSVTYDLPGLGLYGVSYSASCRLDVQVSNSSSSSKACLNVTKDGNEPLINLGKQNFKFYRYQCSNLTWDFATPSGELTAFTNGTYLIDIPPDINSSSYVVQVTDTRGIMVAAASFSRITSTLMWNTTTPKGADYVDINTTDVDSSPNKGTQSNFTAQQFGPDNINDTLTEEASGTTPQDSFPHPDGSWNPVGSTTYVSGSLSDLTLDDGNYMKLRSYASATSSQILYAHEERTTINGDNSYRTLMLSIADTTGTTRDRNADSGRMLMRRFVYPLTGVSTIPSSIWTIYYRAYASSGVTAHGDVDILIRRSNGNVRTTIATDVANSTENLQTSWSTLSGTYFFGTYDVVDQTDYLEIAYYIHVTAGSGGGRRVYLRIDDNTLALADQTRAANINLPSQYICEAEFAGRSTTPTPWNDLIWTIVSSATTDDVSVTFQLYNSQTEYPTSGDGFMTASMGTTEVTKTQTITTNPTSFLNSSGYWKLKVSAVKSTSTQFDINLDLVRYSPEVPNYAVDIEEQWTNVTYTNPRQDLCIKTGTLGSENLMADVRSGSSWITVINPLLANQWNNVSVTQYISSPNFTIRFRGSSDVSDPSQDSWDIDAVLLSPQPDIDVLLSTQDHTIVIELLQNGTMRWLGQNLNLTTQKPIPPVPVRAIHVNQTINGVNQEVPFQIEDWASDYRIPLGLTNNATVFSNRQMIVFLANSNVSKITLWWDGRDTANQTMYSTYNPLTSPFKNDNVADVKNGFLGNGLLNLTVQIFGDGQFRVLSKIKTMTSTSEFMRIDNECSWYYSDPSYVIHHGIVRDIVQEEPEWKGGPGGDQYTGTCSNVFAQVVITLPANATYFTYQLRLMFLDSQQSRQISDLCPIKVTTSPSISQLQTENGTSVANTMAESSYFYNFSDGKWAHHWSQFISGTKGAGVMFTDTANQMLYIFDTPVDKTGAIKADSTNRKIELLPVTNHTQLTTSALDVTWHGAVVTFDDTTPIYQNSTNSGLWILVEYQPTITVTSEN